MITFSNTIRRICDMPAGTFRFRKPNHVRFSQVMAPLQISRLSYGIRIKYDSSYILPHRWWIGNSLEERSNAFLFGTKIVIKPWRQKNLFVCCPGYVSRRSQNEQTVFQKGSDENLESRDFLRVARDTEQICPHPVGFTVLDCSSPIPTFSSKIPTYNPLSGQGLDLLRSRSSTTCAPCRSLACLSGRWCFPSPTSPQKYGLKLGSARALQEEISAVRTGNLR